MQSMRRRWLCKHYLKLWISKLYILQRFQLKNFEQSFFLNWFYTDRTATGCSWDSSVGMGRAAGWTTEVRFPTQARNFHVLSSVHNGFWSNPTSCPEGKVVSLPGDKAARTWSWRLTSFYCRDQEWSRHNSNPPYVFITWCLINQAQRQLYLLLPLPGKIFKAYPRLLSITYRNFPLVLWGGIYF
jgi:hypothetical protein